MLKFADRKNLLVIDSLIENNLHNAKSVDIGLTDPPKAVSEIE